MWLRLLAERRFREGEKRPSEYLVMLPQSGSWAFGVKKINGVSHSSKIGRANPVPILYSERPPAFNRVSPCVWLRLVPRSVVPSPAFAERYRDCGAKVRTKIVVLALRAKWAAVLTPAVWAVCTPKTRCFRFCSSPVLSCRAMKLLDSNEIQQLRDVSVSEINGMEIFM